MITQKKVKEIFKKIKERDRIEILIIGIILVISILYIFKIQSESIKPDTSDHLILDDSGAFDNYNSDSIALENRIKQAKGSYISKTSWGVDQVPRIMFWWGKVNQHWDIEEKKWMTDPDGSSGADLNKLSYCQKFYANTVKVIEYKEETTDTWKAAGNTGDYSSIKMSYRCVLDWEEVEGEDVSNEDVSNEDDYFFEDFSDLE